MGIKVHGSPDKKRWAFHCPACDAPHIFDERWTFNDNVHNPTFDASLRLTSPTSDGNTNTCHLLLLSGRIHYCADCTHPRAATIVDVPDWEPLHPQWSWGGD